MTSPHILTVHVIHYSECHSVLSLLRMSITSKLNLDIKEGLLYVIHYSECYSGDKKRARHYPTLTL